MQLFTYKADNIVSYLSCDFVEVIKAKKRANSMPTRLAFPKPVGEGFQIVFLTNLESLILRLLHCVIVLSFLQH
jgi:hypothetical protein